MASFCRVPWQGLPGVPVKYIAVHTYYARGNSTRKMRNAGQTTVVGSLTSAVLFGDRPLRIRLCAANEDGDLGPGGTGGARGDPGYASGGVRNGYAEDHYLLRGYLLFRCRRPSIRHPQYV